MLRLTFFLVAGMFAALMIAGEDRGQLRPGLANATAEEPLPAVEAAVEPVPEMVAAAPEPAAEPVVEVAAVVRPAPYVEPEREVVQAVEEPVFTLSSLPTEKVPGAADAPQNNPEGLIYYVTASSVNVREGPSTEATVLAKLDNGEAALVVAAVDGEWARIVIEGDGVEGYVALRFLSAEAP